MAHPLPVRRWRRDARDGAGGEGRNRSAAGWARGHHQGGIAGIGRPGGSDPRWRHGRSSGAGRARHGSDHVPTWLQQALTTCLYNKTITYADLLVMKRLLVGVVASAMLFCCGSKANEVTTVGNFGAWHELKVVDQITDKVTLLFQNTGSNGAVLVFGCKVGEPNYFSGISVDDYIEAGWRDATFRTDRDPPKKIEVHYTGKMVVFGNLLDNGSLELMNRLAKKKKLVIRYSATRDTNVDAVFDLSGWKEANGALFWCGRPA
jgi:hypothetical protein